MLRHRRKQQWCVRRTRREMCIRDSLWTNLNEDNKVSLFTRFINLKTGKIETRIVNKNK